MNEEINFIDVKSEISWDEYFMLQAMMASFKSKDPSSKVGCVFVDENNHQITMGYNGMIAGIDEEKMIFIDNLNATKKNREPFIKDLPEYYSAIGIKIKTDMDLAFALNKQRYYIGNTDPKYKETTPGGQSQIFFKQGSIIIGIINLFLALE